MLSKFVETIRVFTDRRPSVRALLASRHPSFEEAHAIVPSDAVVGEPVTMTTQAWDGYERLYPDFDGRFSVSTTDEDADHPTEIGFVDVDDGVRRGDRITFETPGIQYVLLEHARTGQRIVSNPVDVRAESPERGRYWGDIHLHSNLSDGAGSIAKGMRFGRDVMDLDVVAYTDHDTMGFFIPPQLQRRRMHRGTSTRCARSRRPSTTRASS